MVTNVREEKKIKCQQYWPESVTKDYGPFRVTLADEQILTDYTIRELQLTVRERERERERGGERERRTVKVRGREEGDDIIVWILTVIPDTYSCTKISLPNCP